MEKYNFITRLLLIAPAVLITSILWAIIAIFSTNSLAKVLKITSENLSKTRDVLDIEVNDAQIVDPQTQDL